MQNKLAIIVPYRDRAAHLIKFLAYMVPRFRSADIYIIEQADDKPFNRGKLLNFGVMAAGSYDYFTLHDVDMLPVDADYSMPDKPTLLATKVQQFNYKMPFPEYFGGVVLISYDDMIKCNGYHNEFWSWGGEDNNFRDRILSVGLEIAHRQCIFNSLPHDHSINPKLHPKNVALWKAGPQLENGISNCEYKIISRDGNHIKVEL